MILQIFFKILVILLLVIILPFIIEFFIFKVGIEYHRLGIGYRFELLRDRWVVGFSLLLAGSILIFLAYIVLNTLYLLICNN